MLPRVGLVGPSRHTEWLGGLYVVQHLFMDVHMLAPDERPEFHDVWIQNDPADDPFGEIRSQLGARVVIRNPTPGLGRVLTAIGRRIERQTLSRYQMSKAGIDVFFPTSPFSDPTIPYVFLMPDFQHRHLRDLNDEKAVAYFETLFRRHGSQASLILMQSKSVFEDLRRFMPDLVSKARFAFPRAIPTASWFELDPGLVAGRYGLPRRYFHLSNQASAHKNHIVIGRALRILMKRNVNVDVVATGLKQDYRDAAFFSRLEAELSALGVAERFRFLGVLPRNEQMAVMRGSVAVLQPSRFEGWGAAVAESKSLGKPLLASDLPVHREHGADVYSWLSVDDSEAWADAMEAAIRELSPGPDRDTEERAALRTREEAQETGRALVAILDEAARG
jgi:glycosyltransferase involved in cell wall biosynthesis